VAPTRGPGSAVVRAVGAAAIAAMAGIVVAQAFYLWRPSTVIEFDRPSPRSILRGFFPEERAPDGLTFAWTRQRAELRLPGLDRRVRWQVRVRLRGARPDEATLPEVVLLVDGRPAGSIRTTNVFDDLVAEAGPAPGASGLSIGLHVSNTFRPGPQDARDLGVTVDRLAVAPQDAAFVRAPSPLLAAVALAAAVAAVGLAGLGFRASSSVGFAALVAAGASAALTSGVASYLIAPAWVGAVALPMLVPLPVAWVAAAIRRAPLAAATRVALAISGVALFLKLLVLWHPNAPVGDALFQAHRFQWVLEGRYLFTSVAPGGYQFPYGIALYLTALPLAADPADAHGLMLLLRGVVAAADAIAALVLALAVARASRDDLAAILALVLYHLIPLDMQVQLVANLTNMFGQALFVVTLALIAAGWVSRGAGWRLLVVLGTTTWAMLAHLSTFAILAVVLLLLAISWAVSGRTERRAAALRLAVVAGAAAAIAIAAYYGHFADTYRAVFTRVSTELAQPIERSDPGGRSLADRLAYVPYVFTISLGWPALLLGCAGAVRLWRHEAGLLGSTLAAWSLGCAIFLAGGVLTPIDMRHYLAWFPALAVLAALGASSAWRSGVPARIAAAVLLAWAGWLGLAQWLAGVN
jgi:hypothetical protein